MSAARPHRVARDYAEREGTVVHARGTYNRMAPRPAMGVPPWPQDGAC